MVDDEVVKSQKPDLQRELGVKADPELVDDLVETISAGWQVPETPPSHPILLLLGGFQGSGKSTVIDSLSSLSPLLVVSPDEIRHLLFQRIPFSEVFSRTVCAARNRLIAKAATTGNHIAEDNNAIPMRIDIFRSLVDLDKYRVLTCYLDASKDALIQRLSSRQTQPGRYKGTVDELEANMQAYGEPDLSAYDVVFDTEKQSPQEISREIFQRMDKVGGDYTKNVETA